MLYMPLRLKTFIKYSLSQWFERNFEPVQGIKTIIGGMSATPLYRRYYAMHLLSEKLTDIHIRTGLVAYALESHIIDYEMWMLRGIHKESEVDAMCTFAHMLERGITSVWINNRGWSQLQAWGEFPSSLFF